MTKTFVTEFQKKHAIQQMALDNVKTGVAEAHLISKTRSKRRNRNVQNELQSLQVIRAAFSGWIIRKKWNLYTNILQNTNTDD